MNDEARLPKALSAGIISVSWVGNDVRIEIHHSHIPSWKDRAEEWDELKWVYRGAVMEVVQAFAERCGVSMQMLYMRNKEIIKNVYEHGTQGGHISFRMEGTVAHGEFHTYAAGPVDLEACSGPGWVRKSEDNANSGLREIEDMKCDHFEVEVDTSRGVLYRTRLDFSKL